MNSNILKILFVIERFKVNKQGKAPIKCRITYLGQRKPFSTGIFIKPDNWNASKQKAFPPSTDNTQFNTQLSLIKQEVNQAFLMLQVQLETFDVEDIYLKYKGEDIKTEKTLLEVYTLHNDRMKKLVGIEYSDATHKKFEESKNHVKSFIRHNMEKTDKLTTQIRSKLTTRFGAN